MKVYEWLLTSAHGWVERKHMIDRGRPLPLTHLEVPQALQNRL